jgi:hypothetical protein
MTTRQAGIRVTLDTAQFQAGMRNMERSSKATGAKMGRVMSSAWSAGLGSVKKTLGGMASSLMNNIKLAATVGGTIATGALIKGAVESRVAYLQLADAMTTFTGKATDAAEVEEMVKRVAEETRIPIDKLSGQLLQLAAVAGKVDIETLLERSASQARRLGLEGEFISRVYTRLVAKGVAQTAVEAENLTEQFNTLFRSMLGVDLDEAIDPMDVAELAGFINTTGNTAAEMLKLISLGGEKIAKDFGKANEIVEELGLSLKQSKGIDEMNKKLKLKRGLIDTNSTALENMMRIAELGPKKFTAMADALAGDVAGAALKEIVGEEFLVKAKLGDVSRKEWDLRIEELRAQLGDLGDLVVDRQRIESSDAKHKDTAAANIDHAMNKVREAFTQPKMIAAIETLASKLPELAEGVADIIEFIVENPMLSAGIGIGARVAAPALFEMGKTALFGKAGEEVATGLVQRGFKKLAPHIGKVTSGMATWAKKIGTEWTTGPMAMHSSALKAAGGLAVAAAAGYALGKALEAAIDAESEKLMAGEKAGDQAMDLIHGNKELGIQAPKTAKEHEKVGMKVAEMASEVEAQAAQSREAKQWGKSLADDIGKLIPVFQILRGEGGQILENLRVVGGGRAKEDILGERAELMRKQAERQMELAEAAKAATDSLKKLKDAGDGAKESSRGPVTDLDKKPGSQPTPG